MDAARGAEENLRLLRSTPKVDQSARYAFVSCIYTFASSVLSSSRRSLCFNSSSCNLAADSGARFILARVSSGFSGSAPNVSPLLHVILRVTPERGRRGASFPERTVFRKPPLNPFRSAPACSLSSGIQEKLEELALKIGTCHRLPSSFEDLFVHWARTEGPIRRWTWVHDGHWLAARLGRGVPAGRLDGTVTGGPYWDTVRAQSP